MSHSVQMPALGESVTEGTVTRWLKKEGDAVAEDEPLLEVSTDKVDTEVPAPYAGILEKILVQEDETVAVGADLAIIGDGSGAPAHDGDAGASPAAAAPTAAEPSAAEPSPVAPQPEPAAPPLAAPEAAAPAASPESAPAAASGTTVTMPVMGESVTEGTVTRWLKAVGDPVAEDEPLVEIATDKVDAEVPSPVAGTLLQILAPEDATIEVGSPIAIVGSAVGGAVGGASAAGPAPAPAPAAPAAPAPAPVPVPVAAPAPIPAPAAPASPPAAALSPAAAPAAAAPPVPAGNGGGYLTPVVRKLAADHGVDLATVTGTGVGGRIRREDVLAAADRQQAAVATPEVSASAAPALAAAPAPLAPPAQPAPAAVRPAQPARTVIPAAAAGTAAALAGTTQPAPRIRQAMARSMMSAVTHSAQTTTIVEMDVSRVAAVRERAQAAFRAREGGELTFLPFFVKAAIEAARANPIVNASVSDDLTQITYHPTVDLGITVDTPRGQIAPVIHRADDLGLTGLARRIADLTERTASGALGPDELSGATFTVSSAGPAGALIDTPIVVPPQAAILAVGSVNKRPVVVSDADGNDVIAVRSIAAVALSYDQRIVDGAEAGRYLAAVKRRIEDGDFEADLGI